MDIGHIPLEGPSVILEYIGIDFGQQRNYIIVMIPQTAYAEFPSRKLA